MLPLENATAIRCRKGQIPMMAIRISRIESTQSNSVTFLRLLFFFIFHHLPQNT